MKSLSVLLMSMGLCCLSACSSATDSASDEVPSGFSSSSGEGPGSSESSSLGKNALSDILFQDDSLRTYEILIDPDSLAKMDADPTAEQYVAARAFIVGTDTIGPVGLRYKGKEGAWWGCTSEDLSGSKTCAKLSMKVKINWNRDTTFYGMKKIQLHAMNTYSDQLRERVGYWFFRQMGVPAPRVVHARLKINGQEAGLFAHVEEIDGRFNKYHFKDGDGNLYKELWPLYGGAAVGESDIRGALQTNEDVADVRFFRSFAQSIAGADSSSIRKTIETWMDVDQMLRLAAVSYALDDDDGPFHWYSGGSSYPARPHNFYFYEDISTQKIRMIPWDVDHMLSGVASPDTMNAVELRDGWGGISNDCEEFGQGWPQVSASCDKLVAGWVSYEAEYRRIQQELWDGPFQGIDAKLTEWEDQLRPVTAAIYEQDSRFVDPASWEYAVQELRQEIAAAKANLQAQLSE